MSMGHGRLGPVGRFYEIRSDRTGAVELELTQARLDDAVVHEGTLVGEEVRVSCRGVSIVSDADGPVGAPLDPLVLGAPDVCFDPAAGGVRTRDNRLAGGAFNDVASQAAGFGMVNTFVHASRAARHLNMLLAELGAQPLPVLPIVVSAHCGSRLPGFGHRDGDFRSGRMRPLSGGHYRLSQRTTGVPEPLEVCPSGEVHLGPGRLRQNFAGHDDYLRAASHNPATVYHEMGHHLCRHTADFRLNAERLPAEQRNGKPGVEEGICDLLAASLLGTGRPYGWYRRERGERRDPDSWRESDHDSGDTYAIGARWATMWWRCRTGLLATAQLSPVDHDRVMVSTLLDLGQLAGPGADAAGRRVRQVVRSSPDNVIGAYLDNVRRAGGSRAFDAASNVVESMPLAAVAGMPRRGAC